ncbi:MAG: hypothetical protein IT353_06745 [Gemmatimonadaceae bacterium]|nr:hypothetical protein [Gemmatimonadaceae bacterium]
MNDHDRFDAHLQREFDVIRAIDRTRAPDAATMIARARAVAACAPVVSPVSAPVKRWRTSPLTWAIPAVAAAGLAAVLLIPRANADDEFESLVTDWSRTSAALRAPTDRLLALPGDEYLRSTPRLSMPSLTLPPLESSADTPAPARSSRSETPS